MASIYDYTLAKVKEGRGRDGYSAFGVIKKGRKEIGLFEDFGDGAGLSVHIENAQDSEMFQKDVERYFAEFPATFTGDDMFVEELLSLRNNEKVFKKHAKEGYLITVELRYRKRFETKEELEKSYKNPKPRKVDATYGVQDENSLKELIEKENPVEYSVYRSLQDFKTR